MNNRIFLSIGLLFFITTFNQAAETVSVESLLHEMVDRDSIARYPESDFRLKQASSYNRASKSPADEEGWFNNKDNNTSERDKNFIRIEEKDGHKEWVLMEDEGAGVIVRSWMPWRGQRNPETKSVIRFYLDGSAVPAIEGNMFELFQGKGLIPFPLAHSSLRSAVSFFPIPYAKRCKVTVSELPFFYQFTYRQYADGTPVRTFTMADFKSAAPLIEQTCEMLLNAGSDSRQGIRSGAETKLFSNSATVEAGREHAVDLPAGEAAIRTLAVKLASYEDSSVTRAVVLKIEFDDKETVWCPIGDFFGTGIGLHPFQDWYRTVAEDGTMTCRWTMPYRESAKISVVNLSDKAVDASLQCTVGDWRWDARSMYFHAGWRGQYPVKTRPYSDWNYVTLRGRGAYVGDTLTIMNPVEKWWGEGDEKIWVDGEDFPSIFGTGTEDYYAYSWGGISNDFYEHPFHAQPRSHRYDKFHRKTDANEKSTLGYSTETRTRSLDTMPFSTSLKLDMEIWSWTDSQMGYGVGCYWYGDAETTSNREPEPTEVLNVPPLPEMNNSIENADSKSGNAFEGAIEFDSIQVVSLPQNVSLKPQSLKRYKGIWNQTDQLFVKDVTVGDVFEFKLPASSPVAEHLLLHATKSFDYGILKLTVNGHDVTKQVDLYSADVRPTGPIDLGRHTPIDDHFLLRIEVIGKNPKSAGTFFGLDCVSFSDRNNQ